MYGARQSRDSLSAPQTEILASYLEGRDNNLNLIRMVAAATVLISHAFPITTGADTVQPLEKQIGLTLGAVAVYVFFIISGFLIPRSFERRSFTDFAIARILRLFPGLAVVLLLTVLFLGPLATSLPLSDYLSNPKTFAYLPRNLLLASLQYDLPGVFDDMPYPGAINGSLWSLFPEVMCWASPFWG